MDQLLSRRMIAALLASVICGILYAFTVAPGILEIDSGELAAVACSGGVAHPTGYPLFSLLGWLLTRVQVFPTMIQQLNMIASLWCAAGVFFFSMAVADWLSAPVRSRIPQPEQAGKKRKEAQGMQRVPLSSSLVFIATLTAGLFMGTTLTWWQQATGIEVYSLHLMLISLVLWMLIRAYHHEGNDTRTWLVLAAALAFSFSNHLTTLLIVPGIAVLFFVKKGFNGAGVSLILKMLAVFLPLLLLLYLWLPLRASSGTEFNWGNPVNWENFWRHVSAFQYRVWMFSNAKVLSKNLNGFFSSLPMQTGIIGFLLALGGIVMLARKFPAFLVFILTTFFFATFYASGYDIKDLEPYFLLPHMMVVLCVVAAIARIGEYLSSVQDKRIIFLLPLAAGVPAYLNFTKADVSDRVFIEEYARQNMENLPPQAMYFGSQWDYLVSPSFYLQSVEGFRKDVVIVDKELMRRSWYYIHLKKRYPDVLEGLDMEVQVFLNELKPFERNQTYNGEALSRAFYNLLSKFIEKNKAKHPLFIGPELVNDKEFALPKDSLIPDRFFYRYASNRAYIPLTGKEPVFHFLNRRGDLYEKFIRDIQGNLMSDRAGYEAYWQKNEEVRSLVARLKQEHPRKFEALSSALKNL